MAISRKSKLREILEDPRAVAVIDKYLPGFVEEKADMMGPVSGMKFSMLMKFPQVSVPKDIAEKMMEELDGLDA